MNLFTTTGMAAGLVLWAILTGCGGRGADVDAASTSTAPASPVLAPILEVTEPRAQLMPGVGAVYLTVTNSGDEADHLVAIKTAAASVAETHETVVEEGVMRMMARPEGFEIPAGGSLELAPGGKHIMLIEPQPTSDEGGTILLTLHFATSEPIAIEAIVTTPASGDHAMDHDAAHDMEHDMEHD